MSFQKRLFLTIATVLLLLLAWALLDLLTLLFGSIVLATAVASLAKLLHRRLKVPEKYQAMSALLLVAAVLCAFGWFVGDALAGQISEIQRRLPEAWRQVQAMLADRSWGRYAMAALSPEEASAVKLPRIMNMAGTTLGGLGSVFLMLVLSVYLVLDPGLYRRGFLALVPPAHRARIGEAVHGSGHALSLWLLGQGISMVFLGLCTWIGLALLGAPVPAALGLITGLLGFIPFFGSIGAGVLCSLLSLTAGVDTAVYVALLFTGIQVVQEYVVAPVVQRWTVSLPPALTLIAALIFGVLLGPLGIVFATPMMVVVMYLVDTLYVKGFLKKKHQDAVHDRPASEGSPQR